MLWGNTCCSLGLCVQTVTQGFCGSPDCGQVSISQEEKKKLKGGEAVFWSGERSQFAPAAKFQQYFWKIKGRMEPVVTWFCTTQGFTGGDVGPTTARWNGSSALCLDGPVMENDCEAGICTSMKERELSQGTDATNTP